ncbi:MAG TPA: cysteine desulfurase family protein [Bdellovibrionota bacterium]|nr:cysteine desulfurase family protein [Bdellovibrionota bacterium]
MNHIYLDYNATTPPDPLVVEKMLPYLREGFGNPSSIHWAGRVAKNALIRARESVAALLHADPSEILFTSSGTESINLAIKGSFWANPEKRHFITTTVEHPATLEAHKWLLEQGCEVTFLPVDKSGRLDLETLSNTLRKDTNLVSIMYANHETGVIFPIDEISEITKRYDIPLNCDGTQAVGKVGIDLNTLPVDFFSFSAHKFHGPKGAGGLFVREGSRLKPLIHGGGQEKMRRGGTEALPQIVGLGAAADVLKTAKQHIEDRLRELKLFLESKLEVIPGVMIVGRESRRIPNTTMIIVDGIASESLLLNLDLHGIAVSSGAACSSGKLEPSAVLQAMGFTREEASSSLRISYGKETTEEGLDIFVKVLVEILNRLSVIDAIGDGGKLPINRTPRITKAQDLGTLPPSPIGEYLGNYV